jgi:hypothetical protein
LHDKFWHAIISATPRRYFHASKIAWLEWVRATLICIYEKNTCREGPGNSVKAKENIHFVLWPKINIVIPVE